MTGIVSGIGRLVPAPNKYTIDGAVQTDAAINPDNSGDPLLDAQGRVIGVTSMAAGSRLGDSIAPGLGFAIPINTVKSIVERLIETGKVKHGYIGVEMCPVGIEELAAYSDWLTEELSEEYGLPRSGAIVSQATEGGPADEAGIRGGEREEEIAGLPIPLGDAITKAENTSVSMSDDVIKVVNSMKPSDRLNLTVVTPNQDAREVAGTPRRPTQ